MMVVRRLYAVETWIAVVGLSLYLALAEILPARASRNNLHPSSHEREAR